MNKFSFDKMLVFLAFVATILIGITYILISVFYSIPNQLWEHAFKHISVGVLSFMVSYFIFKYGGDSNSRI